MPLLTSPIDGSPMQQINRYGIEIDVCPTSGGVWLDKGELEKIMMIVRSATEEQNQNMHHADYSKGNGRDYSYQNNKKYKKKSALSQVMEIFDF